MAGIVSAVDLERFKGWSGSPEFVLLATEDEQKEWKKVSSDADAGRFVALFWARRDPDLTKPENGFKAVFDARVKEADDLFSSRQGRLRGALTERGKLYVLVGQPKTLKRSVGVRPRPDVLQPPNPPGTSLGEQIVTFVYDADHLPGWAEIKSLEAAFVVEETRDFLAGRDAGVVQRLEVKARAICIKNPGQKGVPGPKAPAGQEVKPPA
jgi:GWxTD domain-containing protein